MADPVIVGLDFGTSGVKLAAVSPDGTTLLSAFAGYPTITGSGIAGSAEQDPADWWAAARTVCGELAGAGLADRVVALGVTGQMQDLVPVRTGTQALAGSAVRPVLLYSDTRAGLEHAALVDRLPGWEERTGNHQDVSNVAAKISWLAAHEPATLAVATHLLFGAHSYIAWRAAGTTAEAALCDVVTASTTGLLNIETRDWDAEVLAVSGARFDQLPRLSGSGPESVAGALDPAAAAELGLPAGIPIAHATGDAGATTDGLAGSTPGDAYLYLGGSGWLAAVTPAAEPGSPQAEPSPIHSLVMPGWDTRLRIGAVQSAGSASAWALETFLPGCDFAVAEARIAARVSDPAALAARPLVLPGLGGERTPVRDGALRGAFVGVTEQTTPEDLYLGVLTGVAMGLRHASDAMGITQDRLPLVGGGSDSPAWRQICADVFGATMVTGDTAGSAEEDPGSRSAARAAADAIGLSHQIEPLLSAHGTAGRILTETRPGPARGPLTERLATHRALYAALTPTFHQLTR
ncbi:MULTISPECIES: FGGY family carbohydrate kinase [unclassified Leucobacter]|uniref:FGGY family carbohydrate kinase n=1 Tax=unclassified Leucobacter TaxID=2621730 RepID=UPI00165E0FB0|nr:FGGY family carbohydrate kinase [Leucobacter sp. CX169]MBC9928629.1 sugar kinase [Leucobacter sp. cx-169]